MPVPLYLSLFEHTPEPSKINAKKKMYSFNFIFGGRKIMIRKYKTNYEIANYNFAKKYI